MRTRPKFQYKHFATTPYLKIVLRVWGNGSFQLRFLRWEVTMLLLVPYGTVSSTRAKSKRANRTGNPDRSR